MFFATYKNTIKVLMRSLLLWSALLIILLIIVQNALSIHNHRALVENNVKVGTINDKDPEFRDFMTYEFFVQTIQNSQSAWLMIYVMPIFAVISTTTILSRDHVDNLYEIEKSAGIKARQYFFGRIAAVLTVNIVSSLFFGLVGLHTYFFTRGGPPECFSSLKDYFIDSSIRILRIYFCAGILTILFYISVTYMISSLLHSGFAGGIVGFANVLFTYATLSFLRLKMPATYLDYLSPYSMNLYSYWGTYDSQLFFHPQGNPFEIADVLICTGYYLSISMIFFVVSFICTKRRNI